HVDVIEVYFISGDGGIAKRCGIIGRGLPLVRCYCHRCLFIGNKSRIFVELPREDVPAGEIELFSRTRIESLFEARDFFTSAVRAPIGGLLPTDAAINAFVD